MEEERMKVVDTANAEHYMWGEGCDGWHFVKSDSLSVIKETMPGMTSEQLHYHNKAQQFFYVLSGEAIFDIEGVSYKVTQGKGIHIKPGVKHSVSNKSMQDLVFIIISEPKSHGDRVTAK